MDWLRHNPASSDKSQEGPPPYDENPPSATEKTSTPGPASTVASAPPIIAGEKWDYWVNWEKLTSSPSDNPGLWGIWPYEVRLGASNPFTATKVLWNRMASRHSRDMEQVVHPLQDWTRQFTWAITIRVSSDPGQPASSWDCELRILVKDLPAQLRDWGICWKRTNWHAAHGYVTLVRGLSQEENYYKRFYAFSTPEPLEEKRLHRRDWVAEVQMCHKDSEVVRKHDFRTALSPENIMSAEIDQRTASGRCKKVVMFRRGVLYANEMTGQRVEAWRDEFTKSFGAFIEPVLSW